LEHFQNIILKSIVISNQVYFAERSQNIVTAKKSKSWAYQPNGKPGPKKIFIFIVFFFIFINKWPYFHNTVEPKHISFVFEDFFSFF